MRFHSAERAINIRIELILATGAKVSWKSVPGLGPAVNSFVTKFFASIAGTFEFQVVFRFRVVVLLRFTAVVLVQTMHQTVFLLPCFVLHLSLSRF